MSQLIKQIAGVALLKEDAYDDFNITPQTLSQSKLIVIMMVIASGVSNFRGPNLSSAIGVVTGAIAAYIGWQLWNFTSYQLGKKFSDDGIAAVNYKMYLCLTGYIAAPGIIRALGAVPGLYFVANLVAISWMLFAMLNPVNNTFKGASFLGSSLAAFIGWVVFILCFWIQWWSTGLLLKMLNSA